MKKQWLLAAAAFLCGTLSVSAAEKFMTVPPHAVITKMAPAKIDGVLTEAETKNAVGMCGFNKYSGPILPFDAHFNVGTDGKNLYISVVSETGPDGILQRTRKGRAGSAAFNDDSFEFVFVPDPHANIPSIYYICTNNKGAYMTSARKGADATAWEPEFTSKGIVKDGVWVYEAAFPLKNFGIDELKDGQEMGLRICRNWWRTKYKWCQSCWTQLHGAFFSTDGMGTIQYKADAPVVRFLSITKNEKPDLKVSLYNPTKKDMKLVYSYQHKPSNSQSADQKVPLTLKAGETRVIAPNIVQVTPQETVETNFEVKSEDGKVVYYRRAFRWSTPKPQMFVKSNDDSQRVSLQYAYYPSTNQMYIKIDASGLKDPKVLKSMTATVKDAAGKEIAKSKLPALTQSASCTYLWQLPDLKAITEKSNPSGDYSLSVSLEGVSNVKLERKFQRKIFSWEGNSYGKSDPLLPRFTPIKVNGNTISMVLRDYKMNKLGLFEQVRADGENLLKDGGMRFEAVINGKPVKINGKKLSLVSASDTHAELKAFWRVAPESFWASLTSDSDDLLSANALCQWDYDGVMKYTLTLNPFKGKLDSLKLIIPMDPAFAYLFHPVTDGLRIHYGGKTPDTWNSKKAARSDTPTDFVHYIWLGMEGRGLSVFAENDKGWSNAKGVPTQELYHKDGVVYLVCNLVSKPIELKEPRTIVLGFQATPIKPMSPDWRLSNGWGWGKKAGKYFKYSPSFLGSSLCQGGVSSSDCIFPRDNDLTIWKVYAEARKTGKIPPDFLDKWVKGYKTTDPSRLKSYRAEVNYGLNCMKGNKRPHIMFYTNGRGMRTDIPESMTFMDDWFREEFQSQRDQTPAYGSSKSYSVDPVASYRDFAAYWYHKMLTMGVVDLLYWDDMFLASNVDHTGHDGAYIMEDGRMQPSMGLWNMREIVRRAGALQIELKKTPNNMVHMTNAAIAPVLSFAQQDLDWEDNYGPKPFQQRYTKEYIRTLSIGRQFGNLPVALGLVAAPDKATSDWCLRTGSGVCLTHEIIWCRSDPKAYWDIKGDLLEFGYGTDKTRTWNYWEKDYPITVSGDTSSIVVSGKNEARIIVCNYGDDGDFKVKPDTAKLNLSGTITAINGETGKPVVMDEGTISFRLKKYDFIYLIVKGTEK